MHVRFPAARLIFVDYLTVLPQRAACRLDPVAPVLGDKSRTKAARLANVTARVAQKSGAGLVRAPRFSAKHDACAEAPWMTGFVATGISYHPNIDEMTAVTDALEPEVKAR